MTKKTNKLSSSVILQQSRKEFVQKKLTITISDKDYEVLVDQKFRVTKIHDLIMEGLNNYESFKDIDDSVRNSYFMFLIIKHFTDIDVAKADKFEDQIRVLNAMLDLEIFDKIINAFPESEMKKTNEHMLKFAERLDEFIKNNKSIKDLDELKETISEEIKDEVKEDDEDKEVKTNEIVN